MNTVKKTSELDRLRRELSETKAKLAEKEAFFKSITERALAGYWVYYIYEDKLFISPHLKAYLGYEDHELENSGETINMLMHPQDVPDAYAGLGRHIESNGKIPYEIEVRYRHKDGSIIWVICSGNIVQRDEKGNPSIMIGCHVDITHLKKMEKTQKYMEELEKKNQELEQYAYVASHDLQEPLNTIQGYIELLRYKLENHPDQELAGYLNSISNSSARMSGLIKGILDYSLLGRQNPMTITHADKILKEVKEDLSIWIHETNTEIIADPLPALMGYEIELRILFQNLISNSIRFRSSDPPKIRISALKEGDFWKFSVEDNGIGIDPEDSEKVFKLYQRLHTKDVYEGNGLGLAQCYKIVTELHLGKIWVEPKQGQGTIIYFTLPVYRIKNEKVEVHPSAG